MQRVLTPVLARPEYAEAIEPEIVAYFWETIFAPLFAELEAAGVKLERRYQAIRFDEEGKEKLDREERENAEGGEIDPDVEELIAALRAGRLWYADGAFGSDRPFGAAITRALRSLGASFDAATRLYVLPATKMPFSIRGAIGQAQAAAEGTHAAMMATLKAASENVLQAPAGLALEKPVGRIILDLETQFGRSLATATEAVTVSPTLPASVRAALTKTLTENLDLAVKNFAAEEVFELRRMTEANLMAGGRLDRLARMVESRFGVAKRKADFLATQETHLLTAKFRMERAMNAGSVRYVWRTRRDSRVRHDHAELDGKVFFWTDPPLVDQARGRHANPGEDYNCLPGDAQVDILNGVKKCFRRWYSGELTTLILESGITIRATPNHPVLTPFGWKPIGRLDEGDEVIEVRQKLGKSVETDREERITTIAQVFGSLAGSGLGETLPGKGEQFHGDGSDRDVDVIFAARALGVDRKTLGAERRNHFGLAEANPFRSGGSGARQHFKAARLRNSLSPFVRRFGQSAAPGQVEFAHPDEHGFRPASNMDPVFNQSPPNRTAGDPQRSSDREFAFTSNVACDQVFWRKVQAVPGFGHGRVRKRSSGLFHGHVFNLETADGFYATANVIVSNCRCFAEPLVELPKLAQSTGAA